jgi:hypothetical protein
MISLCTVIVDSAAPFLKIYEKWVIAKTKLVKEVCFCKMDAPATFYEEKTISGIRFRTFGYDTPKTHLTITPGHQHALGMHECIDKATEPYIFLCDPDIFFYNPVDAFYYETLKEYNLDIIGASHHSSTEIAQGYFPWHGNLLVAKEKLPKSDWMRNKFAIEGKYLLMDLVENYTEMFPNKTKNFDTGSYLWLWGNEQKWRWVSFLTHDCHTYTTNYYRNNISLKTKFAKQNLFYHAVSGSIKPGETFDLFNEKYGETK